MRVRKLCPPFSAIGRWAFLLVRAVVGPSPDDRADRLIIIGVGCVVGGIWQLNNALGLISLGVFLLVFGVILSLRSRGTPL